MPAYCPSFVGVQVAVKRDERAEMKKVITMDMLSEDMSDEAVEVDEGIDMAIAVADVDVVAAMVIPDMSILTLALVSAPRTAEDRTLKWYSGTSGRTDKCDSRGIKTK